MHVTQTNSTIKETKFEVLRKFNNIHVIGSEALCKYIAGFTAYWPAKVTLQQLHCNNFNIKVHRNNCTAINSLQQLQEYQGAGSL